MRMKLVMLMDPESTSGVGKYPFMISIRGPVMILINSTWRLSAIATARPSPENAGFRSNVGLLAASETV